MVSLHSTSPLSTPLCYTIPAVQDTWKYILVFCMLSVKGSLVVVLSISAIFISAFANSRGQSILVVQLEVFEAVEGSINAAAVP